MSITMKQLEQLMELNPDNRFIYYVANLLEGRTDIYGEANLKFTPKYKIVKLKVLDIKNAAIERFYYENHKNEFHSETETSYYGDPGNINELIDDQNGFAATEYEDIFIAKNQPTGTSYTKDLNPRVPSVVYGYRRRVYDTVHQVEKIVEIPSPVSYIYTMHCNLYDKNNNYERQIIVPYSDANWKFIQLDSPKEVDEGSFSFITSDWYLLDIENYPSIEKPLINVKEKNSYFIDINDAINYMNQLK